MTTLRRDALFSKFTQDRVCIQFNDRNVICATSAPNSGPLKLELCNMETQECRKIDKLVIRSGYMRTEIAPEKCRIYNNESRSGYTKRTRSDDIKIRDASKYKVAS